MRKLTKQKLALKRETTRKLQNVERISGADVNTSNQNNAATCGPNCKPLPYELAAGNDD